MTKQEKTWISSRVGALIREMKNYSVRGRISIKREKMNEQETQVALLILNWGCSPMKKEEKSAEYKNSHGLADRSARAERKQKI